MIEQDGPCYRTIKTAGEQIFTFQWEEAESAQAATKWIEALYRRKRKLGFSETGRVEPKPQIIKNLRRELEFPVVGYYGSSDGRYVQRIGHTNVEFLSNGLAHDVLLEGISLDRIEILKSMEIPTVDMFALSSLGMLEFRKRAGDLFVREPRSKYIYHVKN